MYPELELFGYSFQSYTLCLFWGYLLATVVLAKNFKEQNISENYAIIISAISILMGIFGATLFSFYEEYSLFDFSKYIFVFNAGKNVLGGLIFALISIYITNLMRKKNQIKVFSLIVPSFFLAYGIGRIGCLLAGDGCYGIETDFFMGMSFPNGSVPTLSVVHPTPLYESIFSFCAFAYFQLNRLRFSPIKLFSLGLFMVGAERFLIEFIRINDKYLYLSQAQWISLILILVSFSMLLFHQFQVVNNTAVKSQQL